ncbi:MAG: hypothetical protein IKF64_04325 [Eubacterium sp.]|nr:hypothetical protein [Eubacterium sp.]
MDLKDKKAIVLRGEIDSGKSATLNNLINKLLPVSRCIAKSHYRKATKDQWVVLEYNSKNIAIITVGDSVKDIKNAFEEMHRESSENIDLYICTCRSRDKTREYMESLFNPYDLIWVFKWTVFREADVEEAIIKLFQDKANEIQAQAILEMIDIV